MTLMLCWRYQAFPLLCVNITEFVLLLIMSFWSNKAPGLATMSFQRVVPSGDLVLGTWKAESTWPLVDGFDKKSMNPYATLKFRVQTGQALLVASELCGQYFSLISILLCFCFRLVALPRSCPHPVAANGRRRRDSTETRLICKS